MGEKGEGEGRREENRYEGAEAEKILKRGERRRDVQRVETAGGIN